MKRVFYIISFFVVFFILAGCNIHPEAERIALSSYEKNLWKSFVVPANGVLRLYAHHAVHPYVLGVNHSTNEAFVFDYSKEELLGLHSIAEDPDWNPGMLYSMGFYKDAYYVLGSNGLFLFSYEGVPIKSWRHQMSRYSELGIIPSFIVSQAGKDYLIARITYFLPTERAGKPFRENLEYYRLLSRISLDMESDELELSYFVGYPKESLIGRKLPSTLIRFSAFENKVNVLFSSDPTIWQYHDFDPTNTAYQQIPLQLGDAQNNYFVNDGDEQDYWRLVAENPSFDLLHLDHANGDHYLQYRAPYDEDLWPTIRRLKGEWAMTEMNNATKVRTAKFDKEFNHIFEIDNKAKPSLGWFQLVYDSKFFVSGKNEPEIGAEFYVYTLSVED